MTLTPGYKYLIDVAPWGLQMVRYLGQSPWLSTYSKVQNPVTLKKFTVRTELLRPLLVRVPNAKPLPRS